jgi:hypothetical protein
LLAFDWESAGYGMPATDLNEIDLDCYFAAISGSWQILDREKLAELQRIGSLFRVLDCIQWAAASLSGEWIDKTMENQMPYYDAWLADSIKALGWE